MDESKRNRQEESQVHQGHQVLSCGMFRTPLLMLWFIKHRGLLILLWFVQPLPLKIMSLFILILWRFGFIMGFCC